MLIDTGKYRLICIIIEIRILWLSIYLTFHQYDKWPEVLDLMADKMVQDGWGLN